MILSHRYKFIFLKTAKTAGTSIEIAVSKYLGESDVITPISPADESIRQHLGYRRPQNFRVPLLKLGASQLLSSLLHRRRTMYYNHMSSEEVRSLAGDEVWNSYYKFCFERNPFDRVVSLYYWVHRHEPRPPLVEFLDHPEMELLIRRGSEIYTDPSGRRMIDRLGRYETLNEDLEQIRCQIGLPESLELPLAKSGHRTDRRHYREILNEECRRKIALKFQRELEELDYSF